MPVVFWGLEERSTRRRVSVEVLEVDGSQYESITELPAMWLPWGFES